MTGPPTSPSQLREPDWVTHAVWWHVYPLGFTGADTSGRPPQPDPDRGHDLRQGRGGGLRHLADWLDYAVRLGASGVQLGPIFESISHGYDTLDHYRIDPRLGDDADFDALITAAHQRGLRVLLDGVFNHIGRDHPAFRDVLTLGPASRYADWFHPARTQPPRPDAQLEYATFEGHQGLVTLNHDNPEVADHVAAVMNHWLDRGADGWRLDAAYAVPRPFWATVLPRVHDAHPGAYLVGEIIHGDYASFVAETGMHAVTQYELWKAIWSSLNDRNFHELAWALNRHDSYLGTFAPLTFIGNHDVTRIASQLTDQRHLAHALVVLLTTGGTPSLYYGDEQAFRGVKEDRAGGDDQIRPAFPADPVDLAPHGTGVYRLHQHLIGLRRRHPWLHRAHTEILELTNQQVVYDTTDHAEDSHRLRVALNTANTPLRHDARGMQLAEASPGTYSEGDGQLHVPAHGWAIAHRRC